MDPLLRQFLQACQVFNNARTSATQDYSALLPYLYSNVVWQKVNDPDAIRGTANTIIGYLNNTQAVPNLYPLFNHGGFPRSHHHQNPSGVPVGNVIGVGSYQDDYNNNTNIITVQYAFRFKQDASGNWLLASASATPI